MSVTPRILLIDFEQKSRTATSQLLENAGYEVRLAGNGSEVEQALRADAPHLVVLEPMIPGQDGFQLCKKLKSSGPDAPKVVIASRIYKGSRHRGIARDSGADAFLERPNQDGEILSTVEALLPELRAIPPQTPKAPVVDHAEEPAIDDILDNLWSSDDMTVSVAPATASVTSTVSKPSVSETAVPKAAAPEVAASEREPSEVMETEVEVVAVAAAPRHEQAASQAAKPEAASASTATRAGSGTQTGAATMAAVFPDDLGMALDRLSWGASESPSKAAQVLENPFSYNEAGDTPEEQTSAALESAGFELATDSQSMRSEPVDPATPTPSTASANPATAGPKTANPEVVKPETAKPETAVAEHVADQTRRSTSSVPKNHPPSPALEQELDKIFGAADAPATSSPATEAETPVPQNLQGMDAGTADLLSSLEQLENSLPNEDPASNPVAGTPRPQEFASSANELETSVPHQPPEPSIEEQTLGDVLSDIVSSSVVEEPDSESPADVLTEEPELRFSAAEESDFIEAAPRPESGESAESARSRGWMPTAISLALIVAAAGTAGVVYMRHHASRALTATQTPPAIERESRPATPPPKSASTDADPTENDAIPGNRDEAKPAPSSRSEPNPSAPPPEPSAVPKTRTASAETSMPSEEKTPPQQARGGASPEATATLSSAAPPATAESKVTDGQAPESASPDRPRFVVADARSETKPAKTDDQAAKPSAVATQSPSTQVETDDPPRPEPVAATQLSEMSEGRNARPTPAVAVSNVEEAAEPEAANAESGTRSHLNVEKRRSGMGSLPPAPEPPPAPDPLRKPAKLIRYNELDRPLKRLVAEMPLLPEAAREAGVEARAFVSVLVDQSGKVKDARVMIEPGHGLGQAARRAVLGWSYSKPRHKGKPARVWKSEVVEFRNERAE